MALDKGNGSYSSTSNDRPWSQGFVPSLVQMPSRSKSETNAWLLVKVNVYRRTRSMHSKPNYFFITLNYINQTTYFSLYNYVPVQT